MRLDCVDAAAEAARRRAQGQTNVPVLRLAALRHAMLA
jgi:hypothetical protein